MPDAKAPVAPQRTRTQTANTAQKGTAAYFTPLLSKAVDSED